MKQLILKTIISLILVIFTTINGYNQVDIKITTDTTTYSEITLYPHYFQNSVLSCVVFTLKWENKYPIAFGNPEFNSLINVIRSGSVHSDGRYKYQIFAGFGFTSFLIGNPIVIRIPKSGMGVIEIANDSFISSIEINGEYYISIGGEDQTGIILLNPKPISPPITPNMWGKFNNLGQLIR